ncbi:outer membrane protein assembly factor BamB family protein [Rhodopirellula sp. P2]|uniref:outer membrane protein assembly factor BamB family protein n=1 Tax=Rhodopirellula sp. P2 TaxID=2127060 RepID=UPI0023689076|nr:PQQ-binding-like beta-propeller repeat protein [Rhodopirellula sp. P2]WDQ19017.1 PQQ-binding-like beta-propeller repeat protein [Rhodopirellula sp. P2]
MKILRIFTTITIGLAIASTGNSGDLNWPQWRGPDGSGKTPATQSVAQWGPDTNVKWRTELPEPGNSTPIVWEDRVFVTQPLTESNQRAILCFDRETGKEKWRRSVTSTESEASHQTNPYCSASPVTDGERVIAWFGSAGLVCWDLDGNQLWQRDLGRQEHMWGYGSSPILHEDLCILNFGPGNREFLVAVDKRTGETRWQRDSLDDESERELSGPENDGNANDFQSDKARSERLRGSWNTPIMVKANGHWELVAVLPRRVSGFDPATGQLLWTCGDAAPLAYASPVQSEGVIVALGGYGGASLAVEAGGRGDVTPTHRLWHKPKDSGWLGTGVAHEGVIYVCGLGGVLSSLDATTGEELWKARVGSGGTWSSITQTEDGLMYLLTKSGTTTVFRPDRERFQLVAENELDEASNASVVITNREVLIRTDKALWAFAEPDSSE